MAKRPPRLMLGGLSNAVYVATRWKPWRERGIEAQEKHDVTSDFINVCASIDFDAAVRIAAKLGYDVKPVADDHSIHSGEGDRG